MITRAIVESVIDKYNIRVRIPVIDRMPDSGIYTKTSELNVASVCTLPGCDPNIKPGDIVFVGIDDTLEEQVVILGYLYRDRLTTYSDLQAHSIMIDGRTELTTDTRIGDVSPSEIQQLLGVKDNIQKQIDNLQEQIDNLTKNR